MRLRQLLWKNYDETRIIQRTFVIEGRGWFVWFSFGHGRVYCHGSTFDRKWYCGIWPPCFEYYGKPTEDTDE